MNWIEGISKAIEYIEANLTSELKIEDIAAKAYVSPYYFQKSFALLCGFTVGEYIRNRRLASAGNDLLSGNEKVIDIALKYGYESTDSFTKAFTRFHNATPTAVRKSGHPIKLYAPLKFELFVKGGYYMDYRIGKQEAFKVKVKIDEKEKAIYYIDDGNLPDFTWFALGMQYEKEMPEYSLFKVDSDENEQEFNTIEIPEVMWAIFKCSGNSCDEARIKTHDRIMNEWFPQTNYELRSPKYIMVNYPNNREDEFGEIMIAIKEKSK